MKINGGESMKRLRLKIPIYNLQEKFSLLETLSINNVTTFLQTLNQHYLSKLKPSRRLR
jgi:hypothetical protein